MTNLVLLAFAFLSLNAGAQTVAGRSMASAPVRVFLPAWTPLQTYFVDSPAMLKVSLKGMDLPKAAIPDVTLAGTALLGRGPIVMTGATEAQQIAIVQKSRTGNGAATSWYKGSPETRYADGWIIQNRLSRKLRNLGLPDAARDVTANRRLLNDLFDGRTTTIHGSDAVVEARVPVRGAVLLRSKEQGRDQLHSWNKKTGALLHAAIPRLYHRYELEPKPLKDGRARLQLWNRDGTIAHRGLFSPKTGKLVIYSKNHAERFPQD